MKRLSLSGTAREIGEQHGEQGRDEIHQSLETYEKLFYGYQKFRWHEVKQHALSHMKAIERHNADFIEEMEGVAAGSGVDFEDILALNARSEIALAQSQNGTRFSDGCTSIGLSSPVTTDTIIGQNWDWKGQQSNSLLFMEINQDHKPAIMMVTEGGIIGKIGFNSKGVGVCLNALLTDRKSDTVPIHLGLRSVLNASSLNDAIVAIDNGHMASAGNFLIGSDDGEGNGMAFNVEVSPYGIDMMDNSEGKAVHTNHLCSPFIKDKLKDLNTFKNNDSMIRKMRAEQLINQRLHSGEPIDEGAFKTWFADQFNAPNSINHFMNNRAPEHRQIETVFSIIMNLSKREMFLCDGMPSKSTYEKYHLLERV